MTSSRFRPAHVTAALITMALAAHANAVVLYSDPFTDSSATMAQGWTLNSNSLTAAAFSTVPNVASGYGQFLGEFSGGDNGQGTTTHDVLGLHYSNTALQNAKVTVSFDFLAIRSWDGDDPNWGKDFFKVGINGNSVLDETFSNGAGTQSNGPDPSNASMAGSKEQYTLGYSFWDGINQQHYLQDAVYRFTFSFDSFSNDIDLLFTSLLSQTVWVDNDPNLPGQRYRDESWGIDNLEISAVSLNPPLNPVPAPGTLAIMSLGLLGLGFSRRFSLQPRP